MTLRKIDIRGRGMLIGSCGTKPKLDYVALSDLVFDDAYQREIENRGWKNVRNIAENFDWSKFSPLIVAKVGDGNLFSVIDGQHRAHAAAIRGIIHVPAMICDLSQSQQASAFSWINGSATALTSTQIYKAALVALEPWALKCKAVVEKAGCKLMDTNSSTAAKLPKQVYPVASVRKYVDGGFSENLYAALKGITMSDYSEDILYYGSHGVNALTPAAIAADITNPQCMADFLKSNDLIKVERQVNHLLSTPEYRGKSFRGLFVKSVTVLMKAHVAKVES